jgi:hypothetical protein
MRKPIPITGISTSSAYPDGNCISLVNLRKKNGVYKPVTPRKIVNTLGFAYDELFVHQLPNTGENWLGIRGGHLYWIENVTTTKTEHELCNVTTDKLPQITQIGNLLNVLDSLGLKYLIWYDGEYKLIDSGLVPVHIDFKVDGNNVDGVRLTRQYYGSSYNYSSENRNNIIKEVPGLINKSLTCENNLGLICGVVMACTAIELYDGTYINHSNPVLLGNPLDKMTRYENYNILEDIPTNVYDRPPYNYMTNPCGWDYPSMFLNTDGVYNSTDRSYELVKENFRVRIGDYYSTETEKPPFIFASWITDENARNLFVSIVSNRLKAKISSEIPISYKPLIKSISIFITKEIRIIKDTLYNELINVPLDYSFTGNDQLSGDNWFPKYKTNEEIVKELTSNQQFYKVKEIAFDDINTNVGTWIDLTEDLKGKLGDNLTMQEELPVDNFTNHTLIPQKQMVYNSKLHILDYKTVFSHGWPLPYFQPETGIGQFPAYGYSTSLSTDFLYYIEVSIKTDSGITKVVRYSTSNIGFSDLSCMLSYPDSRATNMVIYQYAKNNDGGSVDISKKLSVKLTPSENQNFAYYITPDLKPISFQLIEGGDKETVPVEENSEQIFRNSMKVSAVNNPFYFPSITTYTIGTGFIRNAGTNAIRMSEGQFGQYDLYVFTSEGIYSLDTGTTLSYNRISPASLELPISDIICSTPFGVIFIGKRGLFIINGQQVEYLTPQLEQKPLTIALNMPSSINVPNIVNIKTWNDWFNDYLTNVTEIVYDNKNNEIIIINPTKEYNFVYNLDSKEFYQQTEAIDKVVQGVYPELLVTEGMNIKDFGQNQMTNDVIPVSVKAKVSFITRPFNFGTPDIKKLERLILRARLIGAEDMIVMNHASNDGVNFIPVQGQSFPTIGNYKDIDLGLMARNKHRQFIFAMSTKLNEQSEIQLLESEVVAEYMNEKMR